MSKVDEGYYYKRTTILSFLRGPWLQSGCLLLKQGRELVTEACLPSPIMDSDMCDEVNFFMPCSTFMCEQVKAKSDSCGTEGKGEATIVSTGS